MQIRYTYTLCKLDERIKILLYNAFLLLLFMICIGKMSMKFFITGGWFGL